MMKLMLLALAVLFCCSCATVKTVNPDDDRVSIVYRGKKSYCAEITRVYSGLMYNFCLFNSEPSPTVNIGSTINRIPFVVLDTAL